MTQQPVSPGNLIGRARECSVLGDLIAGAAASPVALVQGEAGIGKTALLGWVRDVADGIDARTLYAAGTPTESDLPFAGLHQLLLPLLDDEATPHLGQATKSALVAREAAGAALFGTAMTVLGLLAEASTSRRLVVVADDVQWLDRPSLDVLAFVGRRLGVDPVAMVLGARDPVPVALDQAAVSAGWLRLRLGRLGETDATELLDRTAPGLPHHARRRVLGEAVGNPLALHELPQTVSDAQPGPLSPQLPINDRLEAAFAARLSGLPEITRLLVLLLAANGSDGVGELLAAATLLHGEEAHLEDLEPAIGVGLISLKDGVIGFRHPLARSAVYQHAGLGARQAAHRALAQTVRSPDRRAWHSAEAADRPDESVAAQLDAVAERATHAGANEAAANALEAAARVSEDPVRRAARQLRAAEITYDLGDLGRTRRMLSDVDAGALDQGQRVRLAWLTEIFTEGAWSGGERVASFTSIAGQMADAGDRRRAAEMIMGIALRCWWSNLLPEPRRAVAEVADRLRTGPDDPEHLVVTALAAPLERGKAALATFGRIAVADLYPDSGLLLKLGLAGTAVGDHPRAIGMLSTAVSESRRQGRTGVLTQALIALAWAETFVGRLARADVAAEEGVRLAREIGQPLWRATGQLAYAAARGLRGDADASEALASEAERVLLGSGANPMLAQVQAARGFAALGAGRYDNAYAQLSRAFTVTDAAYHQYLRTFLVAELAEAAAHCDHRDAARELLAEIEPLVKQTGSPILNAGLFVARPLLADDGVEELYREALADGLAAWPLQRARMLLGYGGWLRRQRRIAEARDPLRIARETFAALGALPWAERAGQELRAAGEVHQKRLAASWEQLTPQELQIATLAAEGLTNRQIGERLFLSHRTVGAHLYHIFPKLEIASRAQLVAALGTAEVATGRD
jgi:DNA-binding CsgD family transcriptional regulator